jgi:hypothetical protein
MTSVKTFAEVEETDREWIWEGFVPEALLTVIIAPPKASKTTLCADLAARKSRGDVAPDGTDMGPAAPVIMCALEDASESSMIKKLRAARADLSMVVDASKGPDGDGVELSLDHVAWLREVAADYPGTAMIVIDTLSASATRAITTGTALKAMLKPLNALARHTGAAVVLTAHTNKDGTPAGGQALISIPRQVLQIERSKEVPGQRTLSVLASNITSDDGEGIRYSLAGSGAATTIEWAWDAVRHGPGPAPVGQHRIMPVLRNTGHPMSTQEIAALTGISYATAAVLLHRMVRRGEVVKAGRGAYQAPDESAARAAWA